MLKLVQFHRAFGVRNMSPYCLKLETYLRMTGIAHEVVWNSDPSKAPKGKLPYIIDGDLVMGDSVLIIDYLKEKHGDPLDGALTAEQKAQMLGETPTSLDATAYGFLANLVHTAFDNPLNRVARGTPSFVAYCARIKHGYFADLQ